MGRFRILSVCRGVVFAEEPKAGASTRCQIAYIGTQRSLPHCTVAIVLVPGGMG